MITRHAARQLIGGVDLPADAWAVILDRLGGIDGVQAERVNKLFLKSMREERTCLQLPPPDWLHSITIAGRVGADGETTVRAVDEYQYASLLITIIERYPNLRTLDATALCTTRESLYSVVSDTSVSHSEKALRHVMANLYCEGTAPLLQRVIFPPHSAHILRYLLACVRGLTVEPALSHDVMAFLAAGNTFDFRGDKTKVKFVVEKEMLTTSAHYFAPVRATTPGGTEFEIYWKEPVEGLDPEKIERWFRERYPDSEALVPAQMNHPEGSEVNWAHPQFQSFFASILVQVRKAYCGVLRETPFAMLVGADNGGEPTLNQIVLVKKGSDYRICSCPHHRPVFLPEGDMNATTERGTCVCCYDPSRERYEQAVLEENETARAARARARGARL